MQVLDLTFPDLETLDKAASFVVSRLAAGGVVYVHCAQGYGRSAVAAAAALLALDPKRTVEEVGETILAVHPRVRLNRERARRLLERYRERLREAT